MNNGRKLIKMQIARVLNALSGDLKLELKPRNEKSSNKINVASQ